MKILSRRIGLVSLVVSGIGLSGAAYGQSIFTILGGSSGTTGSTTFEYWKTASIGSPSAIKTIAGPGQKSIRPKSIGGHQDIGLDGINTDGLKVLNLLGRSASEARISNQKYIIPIGN